MKNRTVPELTRQFVLVCLIMIGTLTFACTGCETQQSSTSARKVSPSPSPNGMNQSREAISDVPTLMKTFTEDVGPNGDDAWRKLQAYPRDKLIDSLLSLQKSVPEDDCRHYSIVFTLVSLNYHYEDNIKVLAHSLTPKPNECADDVARMLARLIRAGDKNLLTVLFSSAPASDAALGEALEDIFAQEVRAEPKEFLTQLGKQPKDTRLKVYKMTANGGLTEGDVNELRKQLTALSHDPAVSRLATEMLSSSVVKQ